ncbi:MAG: cytochrome c [Phycisphaerae bacterium]|nr:cytochrome c [Phycisphaerae bacterium]
MGASSESHLQQADQAHHAVHNVIQITPKLISGSAPDGDEGFAELERRGVRTIVTVDGAVPDVEAAHRHGMRYVHLPVGYHGIDHERQLEIARVVRDLPGPVYVHCHHGKHRGPAAAASAAVGLGWLTPQQGVVFMQQAGTSENYPGLYQCVAELEAAGQEQLDTAPADFPEVVPVPGFVKAMAAAQEAYDHLVEIRDAGWQFPPDHPDLVPEAEARQLARLLGGLLDDPEREIHPPDFAEMLGKAGAAAKALEGSVIAGAPVAERTRLLRVVHESCKACHRTYRDRR